MFWCEFQDQTGSHLKQGFVVEGYIFVCAWRAQEIRLNLRVFEWVRNRERHREQTARAQPLMWKQSLSISCCFTCQTGGPLDTLTGADCWAPSLYSLMMVPQQPVPGGEKTLLREEGSPRALLSLKLAANNRSNLVSSSVKCSPPSPPPPPPPPHPTLVSNHQPRFREPWALRSRTTETNCCVQGSSCWCFSQPVTGVFALFQRQEKTCFLLSWERTLPSFQHSTTGDPSPVSAGTFAFSDLFRWKIDYISQSLKSIQRILLCGWTCAHCRDFINAFARVY